MHKSLLAQWSASRERVPNVLSRCGRANPSLGVTPKKKNLKSRCHTKRRTKPLSTFSRDSAHMMELQHTFTTWH